MKFKPRHFRLETSVKIVEASAWRDKVPDLEFSVREPIPAGIHPVDYARQRLGEEISRHASQTTIKTKVPITSSGEIG